MIVAVSETGYDWDAFLKWTEFVAVTLVIFTQFILSSRNLWKNRLFWVITGLAFSVHCAVYVVILARMEKVNPFWFGIMLFEMLVMLVCRNVVFTRTR